jgi:DNA-binding response OmpR family regulator
MATILVVDDEPDIRLLARMTLEHEGYVVLEAEDGAVALDVARREHPDLILLDVMMPELDGWEVLQEIKSANDSDLVSTPVLMLTALSAPLDRAKGGIEGAVRYLTKPINLDELRGAVRDALAEPEQPQRRKAQQRALEMLARIESNAPVGSGDSQPRPRLSALERDRTPTKAQPSASLRLALEHLDQLTDKQRALLEAVVSAPTVLEAASELHTSRSNIYASLRRISRKLGTASVPELLALLRSGQLLGDGS